MPTRKIAAPEETRISPFMVLQAFLWAKRGKPDDPLLGAYPPGSFVRLQNNEIAAIIGKGAAHTMPIVQAMIGASGTPLALPLKRDTSKPESGIRETLTYGEVTLHFSMQQLWGEHAAL